MQYTRMRDLQAHAHSVGNALRHSLGNARSRPKHAVSEGLMPLAEDKRSDTTLLISLSYYASQHHTSSINTRDMFRTLCWQSIGWSTIEPLKQCRIPRLRLGNEE